MLTRFIAAINQLSQPWFAVIVLVIGTVYSIVAHKYGLNNDLASGIVGGGLGILTGQVLQQHKADPTQPNSTGAQK